MAVAVLGLGGNLGARRALLASACELLASQPGILVLARSPLYHTPPLKPPQPDYLNAALKVAWPGSARALLTLTQQIEQLLLRERTERWGSRTLDIDLLYWSEGEIREPGLTVPHPALRERLFALVPLLDVAPELESQLAAGLGPLARAFAPSEVFEPRAVRSAELALTAPSWDASEILAAVPSALALFAAGSGEARATLPFSVPCGAGGLAASDLEGPVSALVQRVSAAYQSGFRVRSGALVEVGAGRLRGVLVGEHDPSCGALPPFRYSLHCDARGISVRVERT